MWILSLVSYVTLLRVILRVTGFQWNTSKTYNFASNLQYSMIGIQISIVASEKTCHLFVSLLRNNIEPVLNWNIWHSHTCWWASRWPRGCRGGSRLCWWWTSQTVLDHCKNEKKNDLGLHGASDRLLLPGHQLQLANQLVDIKEKSATNGK